jgi:NAD(P)-dependent dehydrogenase (short-subunit alcohol dehydrogenase family)
MTTETKLPGNRYLEETMAENDLNGKVIVITGASSGFGHGSAVRLASGGATVVLAARRTELLQEVAQQCEGAGGRAMVVPTDVSREEDISRLAGQAIAEYGVIDVWVNNAGAGAIGKFEDVPLEDHVKVIQTDLLGTLYGSYFAMRQFRKQGRGILINVASVVGKIATPFFSSYAAAKHGVVGLSTAIREELKQDNIDNIRVCTVMPTTFDTPFFEHAAQYTGHEASPIPPTYDPKEVIDTITRLATDPEDEVMVGTAAKVFNFAHHLFPGVVEAMMARETRKSQIDKAQPGEETSGSLHEPMPSGRGVEGGWKKNG